MKFNQRLRIRPGFEGDVEFILSEFTGATENPDGTMSPAPNVNSLTTYHCSFTVRKCDFETQANMTQAEFVEWAWSVVIPDLFFRMAQAIEPKPVPFSEMSDQLREAIAVGMVGVNDILKEAYIYAPGNPETLTDGDWLNLIAAGTKVSSELRELGYKVHNG